MTTTETSGFAYLRGLAEDHMTDSQGGYLGIPTDLQGNYLKTDQNAMAICVQGDLMRITTVFPLDHEDSPDDNDCLNFASWIIQHIEEMGIPDVDIVSFRVNVGNNFHGYPRIAVVRHLGLRRGLPDDFFEVPWGWVIVEITDRAS